MINRSAFRAPSSVYVGRTGKELEAADAQSWRSISLAREKETPERESWAGKGWILGIQRYPAPSNRCFLVVVTGR